MSKKFTAIDLFSGCGGFSFGFQQAGFHVMLGVDNTEIALRTFKYNHKNSHTLQLDLHLDSSINEIVVGVNNRSVDVIIAGPPCQGFSLTGTRNEDDERNTLFNAVFRLAKRIKPKALIIENVTGLMNLYDGKARKQIEAECEKLGYTCNTKILFAPDYGIPQIRKRVFFVALQKELGAFDFPDPLLQEESYISCQEAVGDLPSLLNDIGSDVSAYDQKPTTEYQKVMRNGSKELLNHVGTRHTDHVVHVISQVPEGGNHKDLPPGVGDSRKFNEAWTRYHSQKPARTIDTGHRNHFHYKWNRVPTIRENARFQSFPDNFKFLGNKTEQNRQVGNAVPPLLGKVIAEKLREYM
jgi:DNA (cytosine-5)-methyltransferase 1